MSKRQRDQSLTIRLTSAEKDMISTRASKAKLSLTDFLVAAALENPVTLAQDVKPLLQELKRIGDALNQITAMVSTGAVQAEVLPDAADELHRIYEQIHRIARTK